MVDNQPSVVGGVSSHQKLPSQPTQSAPVETSRRSFVGRCPAGLSPHATNTPPCCNASPHHTVIASAVARQSLRNTPGHGVASAVARQSLHNTPGHGVASAVARQSLRNTPGHGAGVKAAMTSIRRPVVDQERMRLMVDFPCYGNEFSSVL